MGLFKQLERDYGKARSDRALNDLMADIANYPPLQRRNGHASLPIAQQACDERECQRQMDESLGAMMDLQRPERFEQE